MLARSLRMLAGAAVLAMATTACSQSDPGITTAVKSKLAADDTVKSYRIDVDTEDRVVTLSGEVDNEAARARAVELARSVEGVRDVVDNTTLVAGVTSPGGLDDSVPTTGERGRETDEARREGREAAGEAGDAADRAGDATRDAALTAAVKAKFLADQRVAGLKIDVDTRSGIVTLSGTVSSENEKQHAMSVAKGTEGVRSVIDNLKVGR